VITANDIHTDHIESVPDPDVMLLGPGYRCYDVFVGAEYCGAYEAPCYDAVQEHQLIDEHMSDVLSTMSAHERVVFIKKIRQPISV